MAKKETYDAGSISVLEGLEAVRKRPGMYIGSVSRKGLNHLIYEIVDNAVDEHLAGHCDHIHVVLERDGSCTVTDNGRGIPVDMHEKGVSAERLVLRPCMQAESLTIQRIRRVEGFMASVHLLSMRFPPIWILRSAARAMCITIIMSGGFRRLNWKTGCCPSSAKQRLRGLA